MKKKILGIFTCFNRREKTCSCIKGLTGGNSGIDLHFIAVDDGSTDGTAEALKQIESVMVLHGTGELYYTGGMREGMNYAKQQGETYDYVLLFNDDVDFYPNVIEQMTEKFGENGNGVLVGATCGSDGKLSYGGVKRKSHFRPSFEIVMSEDAKIYCDTFNANCVMIPWGIFCKAPVMDVHYRHSLGDFAYGFTLGKLGYKMEVVDFFVGLCDDNPVDGTWRDPKVSRKKRIQLKESPKGLPAKEWFYFIKSYFGVASACIYTILPYVKILLGRST